MLSLTGKAMHRDDEKRISGVVPMFTNLLTLGFLASGLLLVYLMIRQRRLDVLHGNYLRQEAIPLTERYARLRALSREIAAAIKARDNSATPILRPFDEPDSSFDGSTRLNESTRRHPL